MQIQVNSDGLIIQYGVALGEREKCEILDLSEEGEAALTKVVSEPNGGVVYEGGDFRPLAPPPPPPPDPPDPKIALKAQFEAAATANDKIAVLAKALGL